jgi:hypothetical protein
MTQTTSLATSSTISPAPPSTRRSTRHKGGLPPRAARARVRRKHSVGKQRRELDRYTDAMGRPREVVALPGSVGSVLVVDRDAATLGEGLLVAHLAADEPAENAALVCSLYMADTRDDHQRCRCRAVTAEDLERTPFAEEEAEESEIVQQTASAEEEHQIVDRHGYSYRLELLETGMSIPELRWRQYPPLGTDGELKAVSVREAIASLEDYEPVRTLTVRSLARYLKDAAVSTAMLRTELERVKGSPIVLNRGLRQAVLAAVEWQGVSMSEIAIRCGRVKRDAKGKESGETSWLARRLGVLPEGGGKTYTPWIHSDVLALIARDGLGISPREVELG